MKLKKNKKYNYQTGISLIEAVVTIFIAGLILVLYQTALSKFYLIRLAKEQEKALRVANNKIEELRAGGYDTLPSSGIFSDSQLDALQDSTASIIITDYNASTKQVTINIEWRESKSQTMRNLTLDTLITQIGGL